MGWAVVQASLLGGQQPPGVPGVPGLLGIDARRRPPSQPKFLQNQIQFNSIQFNSIQSIQSQQGQEVQGHPRCCGQPHRTTPPDAIWRQISPTNQKRHQMLISNPYHHGNQSPPYANEAPHLHKLNLHNHNLHNRIG